MKFSSITAMGQHNQEEKGGLVKRDRFIFRLIGLAEGLNGRRSFCQGWGELYCRTTHMMWCSEGITGRWYLLLNKTISVTSLI